MAHANDSFEYCDSEEELFIGKLTQKELLKSAVLGQNYESPAVKCSTPRPKAPYRPDRRLQALPDVLRGSSGTGLHVGYHEPTTSVQLAENAEQPEPSADAEQSTHFTSVNSSFNDDDDDVVVIESDSLDNSVMVISDDESFLPNEKIVGLDHNESGNAWKSVGSDNKESCEVVSDENLASATDSIKGASFLSSQDCGENNDKETGKLERHSSLFSKDVGADMLVQNIENGTSFVKSEPDYRTNEDFTSTTDTNNPENNCSFDKNIIPESTEKIEIELGNHSLASNQDQGARAVFEENKNHGDNSFSRNVNPLSIDALIQASTHLENEHNASSEQIGTSESILTYSIGKSCLSELDYSSLNAVSDSILHLSHGSSLSSPPAETSNHLKVNTLYEDISYDCEQLTETAGECSNTLLKPTESDNLHMSVDEYDNHHTDLIDSLAASANTSQPSLYRSCLNASGGSSYYTACDLNSKTLPISQQTLSSFQDYRDCGNDSILMEGVEKMSDLELLNSENINETSFEAVMQNRQSSFTRAPVVNKPTESDVTEKVKPKFVSKLPVFNSAATLLKPSKLNVNLDTVKANNQKWANKLLQSATPNKNKPWEKSASISKLKTPSACSASKNVGLPEIRVINATPIMETPNSKLRCHQTPSLESKASNTKLRAQVTPSVDKKTPITTVRAQVTPSVDKKTPITTVRPLSGQSSKLVKSDTKTPRTMPSKGFASIEKKGLTKTTPLFSIPKKEQYKNVISPIRAYISGSPPVFLQKVNVDHKEAHIISESSHQKLQSHIPQRSIPKVAVKLFEKENADPNYTRDTLPPRSQETAAAVFMKEPDVPKKHLPKMGGTMQKLLNAQTRPNVVVHHGRVNEMPTIKGVLIPNNSINSPKQELDQCAGRVSVRVVKPAERTDDI